MNNVLEEIWENEVIRSSLFDSKSLGEPITLDKKLIELCLQLPKLETIEEKGSDIIIIWFKNQHEKILTDLRINIFYSYDELTAFLSELKTNNVFLIIDQSMLLHILPYLDNLLQIIFIYIYKDTEIYNPVPTVDCKRTFRKISNNQDELSHSIQEDIEICRKDSLSTNLFDLIVQEESTDQTKNMSFIWYHLLINSLFDSSVYHKTAKTDFINYCRQQYLDNKTAQNTITEFENKYSSIDAIRWYTRDSFVYRLLNKSLRTRNIDIIFKLRFFIIDLQNQLEQFYNEESMKSIPFVYRGQEISDVELDKLKTSVGKYISINTYFSASQNQTIAESFATHPTAILFEIDIQNVISMKNKRIRPVNIQDKSYFPDELEIIFPIGSIFKVDSIDIDNSPRRIRLILTEDEDYERMFEIFQKNYVMKLPSSVLFADLLISMGEYHKAKQCLHILIEELNLSNDMINNGYAYCSMGKIYDANGDYNCALVWFNKALNLIEKDNAFCARIYLYIGRLYRNKNEYDTALNYCHKALNYQHAMDSSDLADLYDEFGSIYSQMQNFDQTVKYLNQSLNMRQSNQSNYREYISTYISLIILYLKKSDYHETLQLLKDILHILINTVPQGHPDIVLIYTCIGVAYRKCEDYESAMIYCQKALRTIENLTQKQNVNATTYILLYITLSDLNDHANDRLFYAQSAFDIYVKLKNIIPERNPIAFDMYNQMGIAYFHLFNFNSALNYFFYALEFSFEAEKRCLILFYIAKTYIEKGDCKMALQYLNKSHQISLELNHQVTNYRRLAEIYSDYSRIYEIENNLEKSIFYVEERLRLNETNNDSQGLANDYERLVKLHPDKKNIYVQKLVEIIQKNDLCPTNKYAYHMILAYYFERQNDLTSALEYHNLSLKYQLTIIPPCYHNLILTYSTIGFIYKKIQDFDNALDYFEKSCHMYVKLSNLSRPSLKDQKIMLMNERYIIENVNQSSLLTSTILLTYNNIAYIYMQKKNNEKVLKYVRKAHEIIEDYQGKKELISKQEFYYALATIYNFLKDIDQTLYFYEKSVELFTTNCTLYGIIYQSIAFIYSSKGNYSMSISKSKIALTFLHNTQVLDHKWLYLGYYTAASCYSTIKNYEYAFIYSEQCLKHCSLINPIDYGNLIMFHIDSVHYLEKSRPWDHQSHLDYILQVKEFIQHPLKDDSLYYLYSSIGLFYYKNEEYEQAFLYLNKSLEYTKEINIMIDLIYPIYIMIGEFDKAYNDTKELIDRISNMDTIDWINLSQLYINMSMIHYERGEYKLALKFSKKALHCLDTHQNDRKHLNYCRIYNQMALIYFQYGKYLDAKTYAIKCRCMIYALNDEYILPINVNITLGLIECQLENYYVALDYFGQTWEFIYNRHLDACSVRKILYNHIGYVYFKLGQVYLAMENYLKTLSLYHKYPKHFDLAQVYKNIGLIYEQEYQNYPLALSFYERALELIPNNKHPHYSLYKDIIRKLKLKNFISTTG